MQCQWTIRRLSIWGFEYPWMPDPDSEGFMTIVKHLESIVLPEPSAITDLPQIPRAHGTTIKAASNYKKESYPKQLTAQSYFPCWCRCVRARLFAGLPRADQFAKQDTGLNFCLIQEESLFLFLYILQSILGNCALSSRRCTYSWEYNCYCCLFLTIQGHFEAICSTYGHPAAICSSHSEFAVTILKLFMAIFKHLQPS